MCFRLFILAVPQFQTAATPPFVPSIPLLPLSVSPPDVHRFLQVIVDLPGG